MNLFQKYILFSLIILTQMSIQSASLFKNTKGEARAINPYDQADFTGFNALTIQAEELFVVIGPNDSHVKLAFFEKKPNGKYQVKYFKLENPNISAEFSTPQEAQSFLYDFMIKERTAPIYIPVLPKKRGYDWRMVPQAPRRR